MAIERITVLCPHCRAKLLASPSRTQVVCPKCGGSATIAEGVARPSTVVEGVARPATAGPPHGSVPHAAEGVLASEAGAEKPGGRPGFSEYFSLHWSRDQGGVFLKIVLALLTAALLSLGKPLFGHRGM